MTTPRFTKRILTLAFALAAFPVAHVSAQEALDCTTALSDAEGAYFSGDFENTIALLQPCITADAFAGEQGIRAYALLGRTHFVLGNDENARTAIEGLYVLSPTYTPDPQLPPNFSAFILEVKQQMIALGQFPEATTEEVLPTPVPPVVEVAENDDEKAASPRRRKALLFGGGAALAVVAGAAILLSGGGGGDNPDTGWPLPPAHPSSQ